MDKHSDCTALPWKNHPWKSPFETAGSLHVLGTKDSRPELVSIEVSSLESKSLCRTGQRAPITGLHQLPEMRSQEHSSSSGKLKVQNLQQIGEHAADRKRPGSATEA